jgi:hypothetical protein
LGHPDPGPENDDEQQRDQAQATVRRITGELLDMAEATTRDATAESGGQWLAVEFSGVSR